VLPFAIIVPAGELTTTSLIPPDPGMIDTSKGILINEAALKAAGKIPS
jgi:hypothetical protein